MCQVAGPRSLLDHFSALENPRQQWRVVYPLPEILLLVLGATLSGMEDFVEIRLWGEERLDFLRRFLPYERGIPSHDTLGDVINALDPELFKHCFLEWAAGLRDDEPEVIAIDSLPRAETRGQDLAAQPCPHEGPRAAAPGVGVGCMPSAKMWPNASTSCPLSSA